MILRSLVVILGEYFLILININYVIINNYVVILITIRQCSH